MAGYAVVPTAMKRNRVQPNARLAEAIQLAIRARLPCVARLTKSLNWTTLKLSLVEDSKRGTTEIANAPLRTLSLQSEVLALVLTY